MPNKPRTCFGEHLPSLDLQDLSGKLFVIEGTDGVGRSTQINDLKKWLELKGYAVLTTGLARSPFIGKVIEEAKRGHSLNVHTYSLLYLVDFADRFEHEIVPALKAGFIVLADRYVYTAFSRAIVRGAESDWIKNAYSFALIPDAVFYLKIEIKDLIPRVINTENLNEHYWVDQMGEGMDYWESGMDLRLGDDFYDSFTEYQRKILEEFDKMTKEFQFISIDASRSFSEVNKSLKQNILSILEDEESK